MKSLIEETTLIRAIDAMILGLKIQNTRDGFSIDMGTFGMTSAQKHEYDDDDEYSDYDYGYGDDAEYMAYSNNSNTKVCFGCAATCALQYLTGMNLGTNSKVNTVLGRSSFYGLEPQETKLFEYAIDHFRGGYPKSLISFYYNKDSEEFKNLEIQGFLNPTEWYLHTHNWEEQLNLVYPYLDRLKTYLCGAGYV